MEKPRISTVAWTGLAAAVALYELACPDGETLSEWIDPHMEHPIRRACITGAIGVTALHLTNLLPNQVDPFEQGLSKVRQAYKTRRAT